ncbi:Extracellular tyrosine-protein kinase PKDCC [Portunus trituberculatus]|uniref:Extracellular tyrosine-protein kinase PKDCC n=1 Tax=Portunus trituberculatus TaxID=210409 RepID=A0A5B7FT18_PORTR|nr:Extracellular tyrosine-protein kinase PKDCC [Portunus trituberculatus]
MAKVSRLSFYVTVYLFLCLLANLTLVVMFLGGQQHRHHPQARPPSTPAWTPSSGQTLSCDELPVISNLTLIGSGWTKAVYRGWYGSSWVAVKTIHTSGHDMTECSAEVNVCYRRCAEKLMQEAKILHKLSHNNVIKAIWPNCIFKLSARRNFKLRAREFHSWPIGGSSTILVPHVQSASTEYRWNLFNLPIIHQDGPETSFIFCMWGYF